MQLNPASIPVVTIRLLGPLEVYLAGQPLPPLRARSGLWLLALLILRHPRPLERDWLAGVLWPESTQEQALANLRQRLSELRRALGTESRRLLSPTPRTLKLDLEGAQVDLLAFDAALQRGDQAALEQALALYRGPLLEGCTEEWILPERETREQTYLQARERAAVYAMQAEAPETAARHLRQVIAFDPLRESAQRGLLQALAASGDYAAAVQVYRELRLLLWQELNTEPSAETTVLFERIRQQGRERTRTGRQQRMACPTASPDYGADSRPGVPSNLPRNVPNLSSPSAWPNNLSPPLTSFIGRAEEKQQVRQFLASTRLLTLTGAGGCGKTRLALAVAAELMYDFPEGVWLVEFAALSDPDLVSQSVLKALGAPEEPGRPTVETLCAYLRSRQLLLLMDNCEHLVEACARLADTLLRSCPDLTILATSREALKVEGEQPWRVPPMQHPVVEHPPTEEKELASILLEYDACRLFVERARVQRPDFVLTGHNALTLAQLCKHLDGIPLALELAAARVRSLTLEEITRRLDQRFRLLTGGSRTVLPRHQTLRAQIDWSYDLLTAPEQLLLRRLSVFADGWTLEAAEAICSDFGLSSAPASIQNLKSKIQNEEVLDLLTALVDKSLVVFEERNGEAAGRYRLLETIRQYAQEKLQASGEAHVVKTGHLDYFMRWAEQIEPKLHGPEQNFWLDCLEQEHDNLRAALAWSLEDIDQNEANSVEPSPILNPPSTIAERGLRCAGALFWFWHLRSYFHEGCQWLDRLLERTAVLGRTKARARALQGAGQLRHYLGERAMQHAQLEECAAISRELGDEHGYAYAMIYLSCAIIQTEQSDPVTGRALAEEGVAIMRSLGDKWGLGMTLWCLGFITLSDTTEACPLLEESATLLRQVGDKWAAAAPLFYLGWAHWSMGDYPAARALTQEASALARSVGDRGRVALFLAFLGGWARQQGDYMVARSCLLENLDLYHKLDDERKVAGTLRGLALLAVAQALADHPRPQAEMSKAARLLGAAESLFAALQIALPDSDREEEDHNLTAIQEVLGKEALAAALAEGRAMTLKQVVAYVLEETDGTGG